MISRPALYVLVLMIAVQISCRQQASPPSENINAGDGTVTTAPPFHTREPEQYQAVRTFIVNTNDGQTRTFKNLIARDGLMRRDESIGDAATGIVNLQLPNGHFLLVPEQKIYAEILQSDESDEISIADEGISQAPDAFLHTDELQTKYQALGNEVIDGRTVKKYRLTVNSSASETVSKSETFLWLDENLGMPVKSESISSDGSRTKMELTEISLKAKSELFLIPADYHKIEVNALRQRIRKKSD